MNQGIIGYPGRVEAVQGIAGEVRNVILKPNAGTPITKLDVSFDDCLVANQDGRVRSIGAQALTVNFAFNGPNGLDIGTAAGATWYYIWAIWNEWTAAALVSLSNTAPVMPAGYAHKALIGEVQYDGTTSLRAWIYYLGGLKRLEALATGGVLAAGSTIGFTHRLGRLPSWVQVRLACNTAELGYSIGDEVATDSIIADANSQGVPNLYMDATVVTVHLTTWLITAGHFPRLAQKGVNTAGGEVTAANWNWKLYAGT